MERVQHLVSQLRPSTSYHAVRSEIAANLKKPGYDDGSLGPVFVRLAWHASGTYCKDTKTGGSDGATMRFDSECQDPANAGLRLAQQFLEPIQAKFPDISYADLWVLASYVAIEAMGGPKIPFTGGRKDAINAGSCPPNGRLPDASQGADHIRNVFYRMGFTDREIVALNGGGHTIGRCHPDRSGYKGPWTFAPTKFSNLFFKTLFGNEWREKKWDGPLQYEDTRTGRLMMLPTDMVFKTDPGFSKWSILYKDDKTQFMTDFAEAFKKLTELGFTRY